MRVDLLGVLPPSAGIRRRLNSRRAEEPTPSTPGMSRHRYTTLCPRLLGVLALVQVLELLLDVR